jgi:hypothetical protein
MHCERRRAMRHGPQSGINRTPRAFWAVDEKGLLRARNQLTDFNRQGGTHNRLGETPFEAGPAHAARLRIESIAPLICANRVSVSRRLDRYKSMPEMMRIKRLRPVMPRIAGLVFALFAVNLDAAAAADSVPIPCEAIDSVGRAQMSADGTITLRLHSLWPAPYIESERAYALDDPQYAFVKRHLGGIAPGETKPVPPLCGTDSEP